MGDIQKRYQAIPYGWREIDIAAVVAELIASQKLVLKYGGAVVPSGDKKITEYLRKNRNRQGDHCIQGCTPTALIKKCREFLSDYHNCTLGAIPDDEDGLVRYITDKFDAERTELRERLEKEYAFSAYPGKNVVENGAYSQTSRLHRKTTALHC